MKMSAKNANLENHTTISNKEIKETDFKVII